MARGGLSKGEVQRARDALRAQGTHPSVDALRIALGNTGSKTTIHRFLKEIEEDEAAAPGAKVAVSEALQDLVTRLAARLHEEAEVLIAEAKVLADARAQEANDALERQQQESLAFSTQLQRTEVALHAKSSELATSRQALAEATLTVGTLEERVSGLTARLAEHEAHAQSLEEKHRHAREALEHYRTSVKEQRAQEQLRHEHQVQELQVALRQANDGLTAKNHDLLQLNRDNVRLLEANGRGEKELGDARSKIERQQRKLDEQLVTAAELKTLQQRWSQDLQVIETLRAELAGAREYLVRESASRHQAETAAAAATSRAETVEALLNRLELRQKQPPKSAQLAISSV